MTDSSDPTGVKSRPRHVCPQCGGDAVSTVQHEHEGVATADLMCATGHIWQTRWPVS